MVLDMQEIKDMDSAMLFCSLEAPLVYKRIEKTWQELRTEILTPRSDNNDCQSCKRENCSPSNPTCMACSRFSGERTDWYEQVKTGINNA